MSIKEFLENITLEELEELHREKLKLINRVPTFSFSKLKFREIENLVSIEEKINREKFNSWFNNSFEISEETENFLIELLDNNLDLLQNYDEEDLKLYFLSPIFNRINFKSFENEFRAFYNEKINYTNNRFIFNGEVDFVLASGLIKSKKPYFFIQEFKKGVEFSDPRPQLIAELIAGLEISKVSEIKGAFIIGSIWNFVILEKIGENSYRYFVSKSFDSSDLEKLKLIYRNLLFVKNEIIEIIEQEKNDLKKII